MAVSPAPISRTTTSDRVADEIRRRIWTGDLESGSRLNQDDLAEMFGVSRIPVREALIALAHEGVLLMTPHRGAFVERLDEDSVRDHYEMYAHIDGFALRKTIVRATPEQLRSLADIYDEIATIDDHDELRRSVTVARSMFHEIGGSPRFAAVARGLRGLVPGNFFVEIPGSAEIARSSLPLVGVSLVAGDGDQATSSYSSMMSSYATQVISQMKNNGVLQ